MPDTYTAARTLTTARDLPDDLPESDLAKLIGEFCNSRTKLAAGTLKNYRTAGLMLRAFLEANEMPTLAPAITRKHIEAFMLDIQPRCAPSTAAKHFTSLRVIFNWLVYDELLAKSPMQRMEGPSVPEKPVPIVDGDTLAALMKGCAGSDFIDRRDRAIIQFLIDTGCRAGELLGLAVSDLDRNLMLARVMGKGRKERPVPYTPETADTLRKYLRIRADQPGAKRGHTALWLAHGGRGNGGPLGDSGLRRMLDRRLERVGLPSLHPHQFRHTWAHLYLLDGGQETDLMRLAGWTSRRMVDRYGASAATERSIEASRRISEMRARRG